MDEPCDITGQNRPEAAAVRDYIRRRLKFCANAGLDFDVIYEDYRTYCETIEIDPMQYGAFVYFFELCESLGAELHRNTREKYYTKIAFRTRAER